MYQARLSGHHLVRWHCGPTQKWSQGTGPIALCVASLGIFTVPCPQTHGSPSFQFLGSQSSPKVCLFPLFKPHNKYHSLGSSLWHPETALRTLEHHLAHCHNLFLESALNEFILFCMIAVSISPHLLLCYTFLEGKKHFTLIFTIILLGCFPVHLSQSLGVQYV